MTTSEYTERIVEMNKARPPKMKQDKLLYEIYVKLKVADGLRAAQEGRVYSHEQVREDMWKIFDSRNPPSHL